MAVIDHSAVVLVRGIVVSALTLVAAPAIDAQGVTTSGIRGEVRAERGPPIDAHVHVRDDATGQAVEVHAPTGRFVIQGLEPGGPYTVTVRAIGYAPSNRGQIHLTLGELREVDVVMRPVAARLDTMKAVVVEGAQADGGTRTMISERSLERLPTLNRDLYDFLRLVPQLSTKISLASPGFSAGGMGFRYNNFLINGVSERTLGGGVSSSFAGNRSIPLDAVLEYQALLAPYDVRYGDFAGALVNAVTRSGTNSFDGSAFVYGRNDRLRRSGVVGRTPYEHAQFGGSLGGPIIRDRLHFFVASEVRHLTAPADGPYLGQPAGAERAVPVSVRDLERFDALMRAYGLTAGSAGPIENRGPQRNLYGRVDLALPAWNSRLVAWSNYGGSDDITFSRAPLDSFALSSTLVTRASTTRMSALHLHTTLRRAGGGHNELLLSTRADGLAPSAESDQPIVRVSVPATTLGLVTLNSGTPEIAQSSFRSSSVTLGDNLALPLGRSHLLTLGAGVERFHIIREGVAGSYGAWSFASLDALALGAADRYDVAIDNGAATTPLHGSQWNAYAGDRWQVTDRLAITAGVRADLLAIDGRAPYNPAVDSLFGRRTDVMPRRRPELSPRVGFTWEPSGSGRQLVRGGLGTFAGRYPLAWAQTALSSYGVGGLLSCSLTRGPSRYPPAFVPDRRAAPTACAGGFRPDSGDVDLLDRDLRLLRVARGSLAYERALPRDLRLTTEVLVSRTLSEVALFNLKLMPPADTDSHGRVMYGTLRATGASVPNVRSGFPEVIDMRSVPGGHGYQLSTRLESAREARLGGWISYTFSRARDVQTPTRTNVRGTALWSSARVMSGRHDDLTPSISSNDVPHRVIAAGSWVAPWSRAPTTLSFYYVGESGRPFTYVAYGTLGRGDLNADGSSTNDPIYVPRDAMDASELPISGMSDSTGADNSLAAKAERERTQRTALEAFVARTSCLRRQRGRILERNSCREPWSNTTSASLRQVIPVGARSAEIQLDVFNVLNLVNASWGRRREALPALVEHAGQADGPTSQPMFRLNAAGTGWTTVASESLFQLQLAARYRF